MNESIDEPNKVQVSGCIIDDDLLHESDRGKQYRPLGQNLCAVL